MVPSRSPFLRTVVQAFASTVADDVRRTALGAKGTAAHDEHERPSRPSVITLPQAGDVVGGHYQLDRLLGQGMFGKVYVAQRLDVPEHRVALKLLPRSLYVGRNVERELVMLATVGHPHVVQLKDHGTTPDYVWLTMPVYQGQTLAERLEQGPLSPRQAYDIFLPMARGLEALHAAGLRHQDVKPENIFLAVFGGRVHPILLDLGVAAERDATFVAGTALYGAPEQVQVLQGRHAAQPLSEKMDTYGLAATLLMALVGPKQFPGETANDFTELAVSQDLRIRAPLGPAALPEVTGVVREDLAASFRRWLDFDPAARPTMQELAEQLEVLLEPEREEARCEEQQRAKQKATIQRFRVAFGAMVLVSVAAGAIAYSRREELHMAAALAAARAAGAASFDKLDTCIASHRMASRTANECRTTREMERVEFQRLLDRVMASGSTSEADHAREVQRYSSRIRSCEESAAAAKWASEDEMARLMAEAAQERAELGVERDAARRLRDQESAARTAAEAERDACQVEQRACTEARDACTTAQKAASFPPAGSAALPHSPPPGAPPGPGEPSLQNLDPTPVSKLPELKPLEPTPASKPPEPSKQEDDPYVEGP